jgi:hypothetical protein
MRLKAPPGSAGTGSFEGEPFAIVEGYVEVPERVAAVLVESFGFAPPSAEDDPAAAPAAVDIAGLKRSELFASLQALGVTGITLPITNDDLRVRLRDALAAQATGAVAPQGETLAKTEPLPTGGLVDPSAPPVQINAESIITPAAATPPVVETPPPEAAPASPAAAPERESPAEPQPSAAPEAAPAADPAAPAG